MEITSTPTYLLEQDESVDNDKLNLMAGPTVTVTGGLDTVEMVAGAWFVVADSGSAANDYVGKLADERQDRATLADGLVVVFEVPSGLTNTAASTFTLKASDGSTIGSASIQNRGRALRAGELVAGQFYELRYESTAGVWQLMNGGFVEEGDVKPGPFFYGTNNASTANAIVMQMDPAPESLVAGLEAQFTVPEDNTGAVTLQLQTAGGTNIGSAVPIQRVNGSGGLSALAGGELRAGTVVRVVYTGLVWQLLTEAAGPAAVTASTGLVWKNSSSTPNAVVDVTADELVVRNTAGASRVLTNVSVSIDIATTGAGGLDTGSPADGWVYLFVIWSAGGVTAGLMSASATAPTMPVGYTHGALIGAILRSSGNLVKTMAVGRRVWMAPQTVFSNQAGVTSYTSLSLSSQVPAIAKTVFGYAGNSAGGSTGGAQIAIAADADGVGEVVLNILENVEFAGTYGSSAFEVPLKTAQTIYWKAKDTESQNLIKVTGWSW